jgi:alkylation response protein AidB-like acyl-CoA dehydrogenase
MRSGSLENPSADALVERARGLAPLLAEHAAEAERLRRPVDAVIEAMRDARVFDLMLPRCYGGLELDLDTFLEVGLALGEGDASMAWVACFYVEHVWIFCQFPESFQRDLFAARRAVLAPAALSPSGTASPEADGYRLRGRWQWGTGAMHAEWAMLGALVLSEAEGALPDLRFFAMPASEVKVEDTWHVDGMLGTGSNDLVAEDVFVPADRCTSLIDLSNARGPGAELHAGPLYRTPMIPILALAACMPAVGQARMALRHFRERMKERTLLYTAGKQSEKPAAQMRLARLDLELRDIERILRSQVEEVMALRDGATLEDRARWSAGFASGVDRSKKLVQAVCDASGAHAHFLSSPLQRALRDVNTLSCHAVFDLDGRLETYGRMLLGLETPPVMI